MEDIEKCKEKMLPDKKVAVSIKEDDYETLAALAEQEHRSVSNLIKHILLEYLRKGEQDFIKNVLGDR